MKTLFQTLCIGQPKIWEYEKLRIKIIYESACKTKTLYQKFSNCIRCTKYSLWRLCSKLCSLSILCLSKQFLEPMDNLSTKTKQNKKERNQFQDDKIQSTINEYKQKMYDWDSSNTGSGRHNKVQNYRSLERKSFLTISGDSCLQNKNRSITNLHIHPNKIP